MRSTIDGAFASDADCTPMYTDGSWLDESAYPMWVQRFPPGYRDDELFEAFDHLDERVASLVGTDRAVCLLVDARAVIRTGSVRRQRIAKTFATTSATAAAHVGAQAFVLSNHIQRGALRAIMWLSPPKWPVRIFGDREAATSWLLKAHAEEVARGTPIPGR